MCCAVRAQAALADQETRLRQKDALLEDKSAIIAGLQVHKSTHTKRSNMPSCVTGPR